MSYMFNDSANIRRTLRNAFICFNIFVPVDGKAIFTYKSLVKHRLCWKYGIQLTNVSI